MAWESVEINAQNVKYDTGKAVLIACPHNSLYDGWKFWHPAKLVRDGSHSYAVRVSFTEDFVFRLKKYGQGKYNSRDVLEEKEIGADEFKEVFGTSNASIKPPKKKDMFEMHKPAELEAQDTQADKELTDDENN